MFPEARRNFIIEILLKNKKAMVSELAKTLQVSEETIRRDLTTLEKQGFIVKSYGGAILKGNPANQSEIIADISERKDINPAIKDQIAARAALMVTEGQAILLDAGSTTVRMVKYLRELKNLTIITTSIDVAMECSSQIHHWNVLVTGGKLYKSFNLISSNTAAELKSYTVDLAFMGSSGLVLTSGFTCSDIYEAEAKEAMLSIAKEKVLLMDETKFGHKGIRVFAPFNQVDALITSKGAPKEALKVLRKSIPQVIVCGE